MPGGASGAVSAAAKSRAAQPPNIIQIVLDDATRDMISQATTPQIWRHVVKRGASFNEAITTSPLCCPSRAALMTGQYAHNNGVWRQEPGYSELVEPGNVLEAWLQRAGYKTAHVGKAMSGMPEAYPFSGVPPGWDEWYATRSHRYTRVHWWLNGRQRKYGPSARNHTTRMINRRAAGIISRALERPRPFFLNIAHLAPHRSKVQEGPEACRGHSTPVGAPIVPFDSVSPPTSPSVNELDVSDKPPMIQNWPQIDAATTAEITTSYRCAIWTMAEVDRGVGRLVEKLARNKILDNTAIILLSDNGYSWGHHRLVETKHFAYEENLRVPLVVRLPRGIRPRDPRLVSDARVALLDVVPTILELAGAEPCVGPNRCRPLDGRSLLPAARGRTQGWHATRPLGVELGRGDWAGVKWPCRYSGVRTPAGTYIEHTELPGPGARCAPGTFTEVYDAVTDPYQLENLAADPYADGALRSELEAVHGRISVCTGIPAREPKPPAGRAYCG